MHLYEFLTFFTAVLVGASKAKVQPQVHCSRSTLRATFNRESVKSAKLEKWSSIPGCSTTANSTTFSINLKLNAALPCGTTRVRNKLTDDSLYYHKVSVVEHNGRRHLFKVSCFVPSAARSNIVKRNVLPPEFVEPDYIEITSEVTGAAPIPELSVGVRQNGNLIGDQITVTPGSPLEMEVYLDTDSTSTYGILVSYMIVSDTNGKNETIIYNGCTQDHYVFENFKTKDGDLLTARFRAFKFPESNYLLFRGTVDVCLDTCEGIRCSNGETGYGRRRRRRSITDSSMNKIFEVTMMTFIKVQAENDSSDIGSFDKNLAKSLLSQPSVRKPHPRFSRQQPSSTSSQKETAATYQNNSLSKSHISFYILSLSILTWIL